MNLLETQAKLLIEELKIRNLIADCTNYDKLFNALINDKKIYIGFDPTAKSLHLGNYVGMCILKHFKNFGFKTVAVLGGATGLIGDPSFKKSERKLLTLDEVSNNGAKIKLQLKKYTNCDLIVDNLEFYQQMYLIDFLRNVGKLINVNYLLEKEALSERLKTGLSYTEFTYPLLQGWDFYCLNQKYDVGIQAGGSDQWGNITTGIEIIRKLVTKQNNIVGITFNLLTDYQGNKFGKSENNALFLDQSLTSPNEIYQFLLQTADQDVKKYLLTLTFLSINEINDIILKHEENLKLRLAQRQLAKAIILDLFDQNELKQCEIMAKLLFDNKELKITTDEFVILENNLITVKINQATQLIHLLVATKLVASLGQSRKLIQSSGIKINNQVINDTNFIISKNHAINGYVLLQKGKKNFALVKFY
ncbi:Tyrosyl-tRNA synthetase [[Mycoplasma] cavipharyngis]|uniref:tyrosine--tRNA ligase n=1 Tax=[Mycoplasma] cavipharyngis TaxID=92757 RepID=UPI003703FE45